MEPMQTVTIRMFGVLHALRKSRGLEPSVVLPLASEGRRAQDIAGDLNLPLNLIGSVYCNHHPVRLQHLIRPGDRMAFVPQSVPGPHRCLTGFPVLVPEEAADGSPAAAPGRALSSLDVSSGV